MVASAYNCLSLRASPGLCPSLKLECFRQAGRGLGMGEEERNNNTMGKTDNNNNQTEPLYKVEAVEGKGKY